MRYGISAAALIVQDARLLLVHHQAEEFDFWVPPGGGLQGTESIFDCARRETLEETGLVVDMHRILYVQELWEPGYHFCKFFILGRTCSGELTLANRDPEEGFLVDTRFFSREALQKTTVYPEALKGAFWEDRQGQCTKYLGLERLRH